MLRPLELRLLFDQVYELWEVPDSLSQFRCNVAFRQIWLVLLDNLRTQQLGSDIVTLVESTIHYIAEHYSAPLSIDELAQMAGVSADYYSRQFKRLTGYNPKEYMIRLRVNKAKEIMELGDFNLAEVAKHVGYEDAFYFSRTFKRVTGMSPSQFAKQVNNSNSIRPK